MEPSVIVTRAANLRLFGGNRAGLRHDDLLHHRLARPHRIHRVGSLVGTQAHHVLDPLVNRRREHIVRTEHVSLDRLQREELATRHLLERSRMENVVHSVHGILDTREVTHIADVESDLVRHLRHFNLELMAHVVLLLFVAAENANLADISLQKTVENCVTETTRAARNQERFATENGI